MSNSNSKNSSITSFFPILSTTASSSTTTTTTTTTSTTNYRLYKASDQPEEDQASITPEDPHNPKDLKGFRERSNRTKKTSSHPVSKKPSTDQLSCQVQQHQSRKLLKENEGIDVNHRSVGRTKPSDRHASNVQSDPHNQSNPSVISAPITTQPHQPVDPPAPITIDLTHDSTIKNRSSALDNSSRRSFTLNIDSSHPHPNRLTSTPKIQKPSPSNNDRFKTFADFESTRRLNLKNNSRTLVEPSWPTEDMTHQRFLEDVDRGDFREIPQHPSAIKLRKRKGKKPVRTSSFQIAQDAEWLRNMFEENKLDNHLPQVTCNPKSDPHRPSLQRLNLEPPVNLIEGIHQEPMYRDHPLLSRLIRSLGGISPSNHSRGNVGGPSSTISHDHPSLRRQHHRSLESLNLLWTQKYAPKTASEMLGSQNAQSAHTLKSWLLEIALKQASTSTDDHSNVNHSEQKQDADRTRPGNKKRSKRSGDKKQKNSDGNNKRVIIRTVEPKKRKRRRLIDDDDGDSEGLSDFIVDDDDVTEDEDTIYARDINFSDDDLSIRPFSSPRRRQASISCLNPKFSPVQTNDHPPWSPGVGNPSPDELAVKFKSLTNLILLKGPHGSGKSCAVQAVADQLGWEVFEVNPGVLRTRKEVDRLIGDVSRNHVLSCSKPPTKNDHSSRQCHDSQNTRQNPNPSFTSDLEPNPSSKSSGPKPINPFAKMMKVSRDQADLTSKTGKNKDQDNSNQKNKRSDSIGSNFGDRPAKPAPTIPNPTHGNQTKQSIILLEEVDIVYGQDKDFWAGVIELVSRSMRPIVMTCNDETVLPLESLPIQTILEFRPPPINLVARFLELVCLTEGHLINKVQLGHFYSDHVFRFPSELKLMRHRKSNVHHLEVFQHDVNYSTTDAKADRIGLDLRRSILQLQFFCQWSIGSRFSGVDWLDLNEDRTSKMLFCVNSLPSTLDARRLQRVDEHEKQPFLDLLRKSRLNHSENLFNQFDDHHFELDWFDGLVDRAQLYHQPRGPSTPHKLAENTQATEMKPEVQLEASPHTCSLSSSSRAHSTELLNLLSKAHDDLSFADAFVDKDLEIEVKQFESEIVISTNDNVLINSGRNSTVHQQPIEIRKIRPKDNISKDSMIHNRYESTDEDYDLQVQELNRRRPFSLLNYYLEKEISKEIILHIFPCLLLRLEGILSSASDPDHSLSHDNRHRRSLEWISRYFKIFENAELVTASTKRLKEIDEYMDFEGSKGFLMGLKDYILDYHSIVKLIFRLEHQLDRHHRFKLDASGDKDNRSIVIDPRDEGAKDRSNQTTILRKSTRLQSLSNPHQSTDRSIEFSNDLYKPKVLDLTNSEIQLFLNLCQTLE